MNIIDTPKQHNTADVQPTGFVGQPAKIILAATDRRTFHFRFPNGALGRFTTPQPASLEVGDIVLVNDHGFEAAPESLWYEKDTVGVVRTVLSPESVLVERSLGLETVAKRADTKVELGNTISYIESEGLQKILTEHPIRDRDPEVQEEDPIKRYRIDTEGSDLSFVDFGGYLEVIARAKELIETQLNQRDTLAEIGARPIKGVLFTGPPGTGKTLLGQIIAVEAGASFFLISGPSIVSKWVGDSEATLRAIFSAAADCERAIIFFDEIDSLAEKRTGDSHEASKRLVAQLLTLMDGFDAAKNVVVIAATNRLEDIDVALRRPGRFDWEIKFEMPTASDRLAILEASRRKVKVDGDLPLRRIADGTDGWSSAELASLWTEAALLAAADSRPFICEEDVVQALERIARRRAVSSARGSNS